MGRDDTAKLNRHSVRLATPFTIKCLSCCTYIYRNKRHNATKETVVGEDYLGVEKYRFYIKCTGCRALLTIKTDPKNGVYVTESGCTRTDREDPGDGQDGDDISSRLRRESEMKDEIERLRTQTGFVDSNSMDTGGRGLNK